MGERGRVAGDAGHGPGDTSPGTQEWAELLVARARDEGVALTGEGGLLTGMIRQVLKTALLHWRKDSSRRVVEYLNRYPVTASFMIFRDYPEHSRDVAGSSDCHASSPCNSPRSGPSWLNQESG